MERQFLSTCYLWMLTIEETLNWGQSKKWQPSPVFLSGEFHGQRSLATCNPWGRKESDTAERLTQHHHTTHLRAGFRHQHPGPRREPMEPHVTNQPVPCMGGPPCYKRFSFYSLLTGPLEVNIYPSDTEKSFLVSSEPSSGWSSPAPQL